MPISLAAFLLGLVTALHRWQILSDDVKILLGAGIMGGMSTFSSSVYGSVVLMHASIASAVVALVYVAASLLLGYVAVIVGERLGGQARRWVAAGQPGRSMTLDPLLLTPALSARAAKGRDPQGGTVRGDSGGGITYSKAWVV